MIFSFHKIVIQIMTDSYTIINYVVTLLLSMQYYLAIHQTTKKRHVHLIITVINQRKPNNKQRHQVNIHFDMVKFDFL